MIRYIYLSLVMLLTLVAPVANDIMAADSATTVNKHDVQIDWAQWSAGKR